MTIESPLEGIRVLDFSRLLPGPFATMVLADLGAEVVRVESPKSRDLLAAMPPLIAGLSAAHRAVNRSKDSISLDLKDQQNQSKVFDMLGDFDVLVEGFRPGVMAKFGLDYESVRARYPRLIYASLTGYGQTGSKASAAGHDINYQALAGMASYSGASQLGPLPSSFPVADIAGGSYSLVVGVLASLVARHRTGEGQFLDISMTDAAFYLNSIYGANAQAGCPPKLGEELLTGGGFYGFYQTKDGRHMSVGSLEPEFCQRLLNTLGCESLFGACFSPKPSDQQRVRSSLSDVFATRTQAEWIAAFKDVDAAVEPVLDLVEAGQSDLARERGWLVDVIDQKEGFATSQAACPIKFSSLKPRYRCQGKHVGEDNDAYIK